MSDFPTRRSMDFTLQAGAEMAVNVTGEFLGIINADGPFDVSFDDQPFLASGRGFGYPGGTGVGGARAAFKRLRFKDTSGAVNEISIVWGNGEVIDNRSIFGGAAVPIEQAVPNEWRTPSPSSFSTTGLLTVAAGAVSLAWAALEGRKRVVVSNVGTETVWIKQSAATGAGGLPVMPGESVEHFATPAAYISNPSAVSVGVQIHQEHWV